MKSIKLKIVIWVMILMGVVGSCIAQGDTNRILIDSNMLIPEWDSGMVIDINGEIGITSEPLVIDFKSEPVEDNEALQEMLELQIEETDAFNMNFNALNRIIRDLPYTNVQSKLDLLQELGIYPEEINRRYRIFWGMSWCILGLILCVYFWYNTGKNYLYWSKKYWRNSLVSLTIAFVGIGYLLPNLLCLVFIDNFYLWKNIGNLF